MPKIVPQINQVLLDPRANISYIGDMNKLVLDPRGFFKIVQVRGAEARAIAREERNAQRSTIRNVFIDRRTDEQKAADVAAMQGRK